MKAFVCLLLVLLAAASHAAAQPTTTTDIILRTDGTEISGRVVIITSVQVRYLPPASADTLRLAAADVFLVRYANGTREVLHPVASTVALNAARTPAPDLLPGLSDLERTALGRRDARRSYRSGGPFWGSFAASLGAGPLLGIIAPACIAPRPVADYNLRAPQPVLLTDFAYGGAYRQEARRLKRGRAWAGYSVGLGVLVMLVASGL